MSKKMKSESDYANLIRLDYKLRETSEVNEKARIRVEMSLLAKSIRNSKDMRSPSGTNLTHITGGGPGLIGDMECRKFEGRVLPHSILPDGEQSDQIDMVGTVQASACKTYHWLVPPTQDDGYAFWPLSKDGLFPSSTTGGEEFDWAGESGARFWYHLRRNDWDDFSAVACVLEFTLPECPRTGIYRWGTHCNFFAPTDWYTDSAKAILKGEWAFHASPDGGSFPTDYRSEFLYKNFLFLKEVGISELGGVKTSSSYIEGTMNVQRGVAPKVFVGMSLSFYCTRHEIVSTAHLGGAGDYFRFGGSNWDGVKYEIIPTE